MVKKKSVHTRIHCQKEQFFVLRMKVEYYLIENFFSAPSSHQKQQNFPTNFFILVFVKKLFISVGSRRRRKFYISGVKREKSGTLVD